VKVVLTIFSPIVRISPPLGQFIERDERKGQRASLSCWNVWRFTENMVEKCVVYGCSNSNNKQKGISMHKIPSDSDPRAEVRRRRQRWIKFVNQTRKHWTPGKTSSICSMHFKHEDFTRPFNSNLKRVLREDEFGVCVWPTIHVGKRASKNEHKSSPTKRQKRMASKLLLDLLLSPWICHVFYQIMSKIFFLYSTSDRPKKG